MNDSTNQQNGASQDKGQPQQGQSGDKAAQPNAPEHKGDNAQQEQKQDNAPKQDGDKQADDKSSSPS